MNIKKFLTDVVGENFLDGDCAIGFDADGEMVIYLGVTFDGTNSAPIDTDQLNKKRSRCGGDCSGCDCGNSNE